MKNIFARINIETIKIALKEVTLRFPIPLLMIVITFALFGYNISVDNIPNSIETILFKSIISSIVVFFLSAASVLLGESIEKLSNQSLFLQAVAAAFGMVFYYFFGGESFNFFWSERVVYIILIFVGIAAFLFFAPFVQKVFDGDYEQESYYNYFVKISFLFFMSFILGGALTALGFIGLGAIFTLFELDQLDQGKFFAYFANFSLVVFTPIFALSLLPQKYEIKTEANLHSFFVFLLKYIGVPFIYIYFLILYAYSIKVLLNFNEWPHGEVSWMVIWFSTFGYLIYIYSYQLEKQNAFIENFRKYFPFVVLPQVVMLFYAIYLRIDQYDLTINRYFVVVFGIWLTIISIYFALSQRKTLALIPMILFDFIVIISIGPWSVYNLPESRQLNILESNLVEANILVNNEIILPENKSDIAAKISGKIYDLIGYLINNHGISSVENLFPQLIADIKAEDEAEFEKNKQRELDMYSGKEDEEYMQEVEDREYMGISYWTLIHKLREKLKVEYYDPNRASTPETLYFGLDGSRANLYPIQLENYDFITIIGGENSWEIIESKSSYIHAIIDMKDKSLSLKDGDQVLESVNVGEIEEKLLEINTGQNENYIGEYSKDDLTFIVNGEKNDYKIFFQNISISNPEYMAGEENADENIITDEPMKIETRDLYLSGNGFILVREK